MPPKDTTREALQREISQLRRDIERLHQEAAHATERLAQAAEAEETLRAIRAGEVDALVVSGPQGNRVFSLTSAEQPYRVLIEQMREGAVTLVVEGTIHYANRAFAEMLKRPLEGIMGTAVADYVAEADRPLLDALRQQALAGSARGQVSFRTASGTLVPAYVSLNATVVNGVSSLCMVVTDLTEQKRGEKVLASERFARAILNQAADAILVCDAQGKLSFANAAAHRLGTLDPETGLVDAVPAGWGQAFAVDGRPLAGRDWPLAQALRGQSVAAQEVHLVPAEGPPRDLLISATPLREPEGAVTGVIATLTDITERKAAEQAVQRQNEELQATLEELRLMEEELRTQNDELTKSQEGLLAQQQRYEDLFDFAPDAYLTTDAEGVIQEANCAALLLLNVHAKALVGVPLSLYVAQEQRDAFEAQLLHLHKPGTRLECDLLLQPHQRPAFTAAVTVAAMSERQQQPGACRWLIRDITPRRKAQEALAQAKQMAEEANAAKDQFLAVLSHELRTPLTPVLAMAQILEADAQMPTKVRDGLAMIRRNAELEARLIDDLLDSTRIARGKLELHFGPTDVHRKIANVVEMCQEEVREKQQQLTVDLEATYDQVQADGARLQQVLWNILRNAIKFTPVGGSIRIHTSNTPGRRFAIAVHDTGIGIAPEFLPRLFNAFEQGGREMTRQFGGLGLGLSISKALVDMHGGTLTATSPGKGQGATFVVTLPLTVPSPEAKPTADPAPSATARSGGRILLVEDHADTRRVMAQVLAASGHQVQTAASVDTALAQAHAGTFDVLISDLGLPDGSGLDVMRRLGPRLKGIALSGFGMAEDQRKSLEAGFRVHLTKPVNLAELEATIRRLLNEDLGPGPA